LAPSTVKIRKARLLSLSTRRRRTVEAGSKKEERGIQMNFAAAAAAAAAWRLKIFTVFCPQAAPRISDLVRFG
jgi:hypothetical protein